MSICYFVFYEIKVENKQRKDKRIIILHNNTTPKDNREAYLSASATLEAALIIPIFMYAVLAVAYMIQIISIKSSMMQSMYDTVRDLSGYAYIYKKVQNNDNNDLSQTYEESDNNLNQMIQFGITTGSVKALLLSKLGNDFCTNSHIVGGNLGLSLIQSEFLNQENEIHLNVLYVVKNPFDFLGISLVTIEQQFVTKAWLGEDAEKGKNNDSGDQIVYITQNGTVYHKDKNCTYLNITITLVPYAGIDGLRNAGGGKYSKCEICGKNEITQQVYITKYGDRYHTTPNCSGLKRTIMSIPISEVGDRHACSKCGGG